MTSRILLAALVLTAMPALAQLYKWTDENGKIHYTETPPPAGRASQQIKTPAQLAPPAPPVKASTQAQPETPAQAEEKKSGKGKRRPPAVAVEQSDADLLSGGTWATGSGGRVSVRLSFSSGPGGSIRIGQIWTVGWTSQIDTASKYSLNGAAGRGTLSALDDPGKVDLPRSFSYQLEGAVLLITVPSGQFAGRYRLTRSSKQ